MKTYTKSNGDVVTIKSNASLVNLAKKSGLFFVASRAAVRRRWALTWSDAPYALCMRGNEYPEIWGLPCKMSLVEALRDYDYLADHSDAIAEALGVEIKEQ